MDSITRLSQKILAERAAQRNQIPSTAPPPYSESDMDPDDDEDPDDESSAPVKLIVNAAHSIQGSGNLVPTSATPLADATKFSTLLLHAVNQINAANKISSSSSSGTSICRRPIKVDLTINCGITVVGDRNVIGNVGVKPNRPNGVAAPTPSLPTAATGPTAAVAGAKRKSEEPAAEEEPAAKKVATGEEGGA